MARSLKKIALVVTLGTALSKLGGLARQLVIAAAFGVGPAYDAYNYAYVMPGFLLVLLGGINGPFHNAMVTVLSRTDKKEGAYVLAALNSFVGIILFFLTLFLFFTADNIISLLGPALNPEIHQIAVIQLKIMAPISLFAGLIGLGFGSLNAREEFWLPSISPIISSLAIIFGIIFLWIQVGSSIDNQSLALKGGIVLAISTLGGAILQWLIQIPTLFRKGLSKIQLIFDWNNPGVKEVLKVMGPATISAGMLQINVFTDLFFASGILGAAAGLGYASLLIQTPLGLISNALIIPLLPTFSKLTRDEDRPELIKRVRQGIMLSMASMIPIGALFIVLGDILVTLIYQRGAFGGEATTLVKNLLIAYGIGMPAYLGRELLVRVFYSLGDGFTPFRLSILGIGLNVLLDWFFVGGPTPWGNQIPFNFGASGLVFATTIINIITFTLLLIKLNHKLKGLPINEWLIDTNKLFLSGAIAGTLTWAFKSAIDWQESFTGLFFEITLSGIFGFFLYTLIGKYMGIKEINNLLGTLKKIVL